MCDPISCLVAGCICCVCCLVTVGIGGFWFSKLAGAAQVLFQALTCANQTISSHMDDLEEKDPSFKDRCLDLSECQNTEQLSEEKKMECKKVVLKCECDVMMHLVDMTDPTFEESVSTCCDEFKNMENIEHDIGAGAVKMCQEMVHNITSNFTEMASCCKSDHPEECRFSTTDRKNFMPTDGIISQFEMVRKTTIGKSQQHYALHQPGTIGAAHEATLHAALFGSATVFGALAMVAVVRFRKGRMPSHAERCESELVLSSPLE